MKLSQRGSACALRLRRVLVNPSPPPITPLSYAQAKPSLVWRPCPTRMYASTTASKILVRYQDGSSASRFSRSAFDICMQNPAASFESASPDEYYACFQRFVIAMLDSNGKLDQAGKQLRLSGYSAEVVYEMGCIIHWDHSVFSISMDAWSAASAMGSHRATFSLVSSLIASKRFGKVPGMRNVEASFRQIVMGGKNPAALFLQGELFFARGQYDAAAASLERALKLDSPDFEWKPLCELCLGRTYIKLQRPKDAIRILSSESMGFPDTQVELGKLLRSVDPEKAELHFWRAGALRNKEALTHLAEMAMEKSSNATDPKTKKEHLAKAMEWSRLASSTADH